MSVAKSDVVTTLTLVAEIPRKSLQSDMGRWPMKLVLRITTSLWKAKTNITSEAIIWVIAPSGIKNVMSLFISPFTFWWLPFSEISDMPAGSGATDSQDAIRLFPMSQAGPTYTLEQWWGPCVCAWESLSTLTGMGITLTAVGPGVLGPVAQHQAEYQTQKMSSSFFWPAS